MEKRRKGPRDEDDTLPVIRTGPTQSPARNSAPGPGSVKASGTGLDPSLRPGGAVPAVALPPPPPPIGSVKVPKIPPGASSSASRPSSPGSAAAPGDVDRGMSGTTSTGTGMAGASGTRARTSSPEGSISSSEAWSGKGTVEQRELGTRAAQETRYFRTRILELERRLTERARGLERSQKARAALEAEYNALKRELQSVRQREAGAVRQERDRLVEKHARAMRAEIEKRMTGFTREKDQLQAEISRRDRALVEQKAHQQQLRTQVEEREQRLEQREDQLQQLQTEVRERDQKLRQQEQQLQTLQAQVEEREQRLRQRELQLQTLQAEVDEREERSRQQEQQLQTLQAQAEEREQRLRRQEDQLQQLQMEVGRREQNLPLQEQHLQTPQAQVEAREPTAEPDAAEVRRESRLQVEAVRPIADRPPEPPGDEPEPEDDLKRIRGIGPRFERALKDIGIKRYEQIAAWGPEDIEPIAERVGVNAKRIVRDGWVQSAQALALQGGDATQEAGKALIG